MSLLSRIPPEILFEHVIEYLHAEDLVMLQATCQNKQLVQRKQYLRAWLKIYGQQWKIDLSQMANSNSENIFTAELERELRMNYKLSVPIPRDLLSQNVLTVGLTIDNGTVSYSGIVQGQNNCVQSIVGYPAPLLRPKKSNQVSTFRLSSNTLIYDFMNMFFKRLAGKFGQTENAAAAPSSSFRFVAPFLLSANVWFLRPRSIAYYEVTIERNHVPRSQDLILSGESTSDCIAVGLAAEGFTMFDILPGWDSKSYGYHGDDGAIFHGRGRALKRFGPSFGFGDVVGCGLNYSSGEIFFTLNGNHLGTAFKNVDATQMTLHPTVGIDAKASVSFNFGLSKPFSFPLQRML